MAPSRGAPRGTAISSEGSTIAPPPPRPAPGPLEADGVAWRGHGDLAFVSDNRLYVLGDDGVLTRVQGPTGVGAYHAPAWSDDGQWLAFAYDVAPTQIPDGLPAADEPADDTLWLVHAGQTVAHEVAPMDVGQFAWSPAGPPVLAFETVTFDGLAQSLWTVSPGRPAAAAPGLATQMMGGFAWSPDATHLAIVAGHVGLPDGPGPLWELEVIPVGGGSPAIWYRSTQDGVDLEGWWPDGRGLLFWIDPGSSEAADGLTLYSQTSGGPPRALATTLVSRSWVSWSRDAAEPGPGAVAVVAGDSRVIWNGHKRVETCDPVSGTCRPVAGPRGTVTLSPAWASARQLFFVAASDTGPFGPKGDAGFSNEWLARWDASARLWSTTARGPVVVKAAGSGVVDAQVVGTSGLLYVREDALWWLASGGTGVRVAGPLFSSASPGGYYGQVDWASMFAWRQPAPA